MLGVVVSGDTDNGKEHQYKISQLTVNQILINK